jgi:hypothetical protein
MARTPNTPAQPTTAIEVLPALAQRHADTQDALTLAETQLATRVRAVAAQLKYEGSVQPDALENGARDAIRRINLGVFELGGYLLMMREACPHGGFAAAMERLDLEPRAAQQYMQVTKRFANANSNSHLAHLGKTKLLQMLVLDDEQMEELELTGQTGELKLDDVAGMSVRELRKALRDSRQEKQAVEKLVETKNKQIDKLQLVHVLPADEKLEALMKTAATITRDALGAITGGVRQALLALNDAPSTGDTNRAVFMAGLVGQIQADLNALRSEFNLPDVSNAHQQQLLAEMAEWDK